MEADDEDVEAGGITDDAVAKNEGGTAVSAPREWGGRGGPPKGGGGLGGAAPC